MESRLTLSNRPENVRLLLDFIRHFSQERNLSKPRRESLEKAAAGIFQHLVGQAYRPDQPGSIAVILEDKGPRVRLMFEDDAPPHNPMAFNNAAGAKGAAEPGLNLTGVRKLSDSLIYYRTADRKNRLVVFIT